MIFPLSYLVWIIVSRERSDINTNSLGTKRHGFLKPGDNQAVFTNLSPGNFTLKVWATDQENQWSNQPNLLPIQILAPGIELVVKAAFIYQY